MNNNFNPQMQCYYNETIKKNNLVDINQSATFLLRNTLGIYRGIVFIYSVYLDPIAFSKSGSSKKWTANSMYPVKAEEKHEVANSL